MDLKKNIKIHSFYIVWYLSLTSFLLYIIIHDGGSWLLWTLATFFMLIAIRSLLMTMKYKKIRRWKNCWLNMSDHNKTGCVVAVLIDVLKQLKWDDKKILEIISIFEKGKVLDSIANEVTSRYENKDFFSHYEEIIRHLVCELLNDLVRQSEKAGKV